MKTHKRKTVPDDVLSGFRETVWDGLLSRLT